MKEYKKITKSYETEEVSKVICDNCGKEINIFDKDTGERERYVDITIKTRNTYCQQDESTTNQLCNDCARQIYNWFDYKMATDKYYAMDSDYIDPTDDIDQD
jgi:hypothetical protein